MDSARTVTNNASKPYFEPLEKIYEAKSQPQNANSSTPVGVAFFKSALLNDKVIFFQKARLVSMVWEKFSESLWIFDIKKLRWGKVRVAGRSTLADCSKEDYSICATQSNELVLIGYHSPYIYIERLSKAESGGPKWTQSKSSNEDVAFRQHHSSDSFEDKVYVFGGLNKDDDPIDNLYEYSLTTNEWKEISFKQTKPSARYKHSTTIHENKLFVFGGMKGQSSFLKDLWSLDLRTQTWTKNSSSTKLTPYIKGLTSMCGIRESILIFGGEKPIFDEVFFFNTGEWRRTETEKLPNPTALSPILRYESNKFLIFHEDNFYQLSLDLSKFEDQEEGISALPRHMKNLFESDYHDVKFQVEGREINAYKGILVSRCPYFQRMFASGMRESQDKVIAVQNVKFEVFHKLIEFIYCDDIEITSKIAVDLLKLSHEYLLPSLSEKCGKCLARTINGDNFLGLARLAEQYQSENLKKQILAYFMELRKSLLKNLTFDELPRFLLEGYMKNMS